MWRSHARDWLDMRATACFGVIGFGFGFIPAVNADDEMAFGDVDACVVLGTHQ